MTLWGKPERVYTHAEHGAVACTESVFVRTRKLRLHTDGYEP